jgi:PIN domain nuclease of toxin-antitoxin system
MAFVIDASVILASLNKEPGGERLSEYLDDGLISAATYIEVATRLLDAGLTFEAADRTIRALQIPITEVTVQLAMRAAELRNATRQHGLSMGDRICLATAGYLGAIAITADRAWEGLDVGVQIELIR